uniref:Uncharacterized protein n=1 Tax=Oryza glaberrima TaxID=4538 RepID=I1QFU5_ORYGL
MAAAASARVVSTPPSPSSSSSSSSPAAAASASPAASAVVWASNHLLGNGHIVVVLLRSWSEFARTGTFAGGLNLDRSVLSRPHSPPRYSAAVDGMFVPWDHEHEVNPLTGEASFVERLYYVEAADIARLREEARATSVQAVSAYLWKKLAAVVSSSASIAKSDTAARRCSMGYWVDLRWRVRSPDFCRALRSYVGNATTYVEREEPADAVLKKPLGEVAAMVRRSCRPPAPLPSQPPAALRRRQRCLLPPSRGRRHAG